MGQWARRGYIRSSHSDVPPRVYSFQDIAESIVVHELLQDGVPHQDIKRTINGLRDRFGDWPLTHASLATVPGGGSIKARQRARLLVLEDDRAYELADPGWQQVAGVELNRVVNDLRRGGWAVRDLPDIQHIEVNPDRLSGRPTIRGRRVPVEKVAELASSPGGITVLHDDYELVDEEIRDAVRWWKATQGYEAVAA